MSILDLAVRSDWSSSDNRQQSITWTINIDEGEVECTITIIQSSICKWIYVEDLHSDIRGYGARLFAAVLDYIDNNYPRMSIVLRDGSQLTIDDCTVNLWIIMLLTRGELSYYSKFGFRPHVAIGGEFNWIDGIEYATQCDLYCDKIKQLTSKEMIMALRTYRYKWAKSIVEILSGRDDRLAITEIRESSLNLVKLGINPKQLEIIMESEWGIIRHNMVWIRQI